MKKITLSLTLLSISLTQAQTKNASISDAGDIAIVAYHDNPDGFSFVLLDDCPNNTTIYFIDEEWTGAAFASATTEGEVTWTNNTGAIISQGTVIHIENANDNSPGILASQGIATESDGGFSLGLTEDEIIAITGTRSSPGTFLTYFGDSDSMGSTLAGTSLTNGTNAIYTSTVTEGYYSGSNDCDDLTINECAQQINNVSNWTFGSYTYPDVVPNTIDVSGVLSINEPKVKSFVFSPNPVHDKLNIQCSENINLIEIYNSFGKKIISKSYDNTKIELELHHLSSGIYHAICKSNTKNQNFQFVKK